MARLKNKIGFVILAQVRPYEDVFFLEKSGAINEAAHQRSNEAASRFLRRHLKLTFDVNCHADMLTVAVRG